MQASGPPTFNANVPHFARVYDYWSGGKDNFAVDRELGEVMLKAVPGLGSMAAENRRFVHRSTRDLVVHEGIRQFIDFGCGLPFAPNLHEVAQHHVPETRVVYVDNDPLVLAHARALLHSHPAGRIEVVGADLRDPAAILSHPVLLATVDRGRPVGLTVIGTLMLLADDDNPWSLVEQLRNAVPSGSCLVVSHLTVDFQPAEVSAAVTAAGDAGMTLVARTREEVRRFFGSWELLGPGLVPVSVWRPDLPTANPVEASWWAGVARKP
ncbi:SAM-dependent methyltransferase [Actinoplanes couchii]|nr:SAM-dependent methyltransferase [Actinoplanes couchii]